MGFALDLREGLSASYSKYGVLKDEPDVLKVV